MRKTFKYRLFTSRLQSELLDVQLGEACRLYNAALQERRDAWKQRVSLNYYTQANQLKEIRAAGDLGLANFSCCQDILRRVNKTYEAFFRRVQRGEKVGYPRFKSRRRFDSITFPSYGDGIKLNAENLHVKGLAGGMLAKSVHDVSWAAFFSKLAYKAESAGRVLKTVNPCGTSQTCTCGAKVRKELSDREHVCTACGLIAPRDVVSAQVILQRARMSPSNRNVAERIACVV